MYSNIRPTIGMINARTRNSAHIEEKRSRRLPKNTDKYIFQHHIFAAYRYLGPAITGPELYGTGLSPKGKQSDHTKFPEGTSPHQMS